MIIIIIIIILSNEFLTCDAQENQFKRTLTFAMVISSECSIILFIINYTQKAMAIGLIGCSFLITITYSR